MRFAIAPLRTLTLTAALALMLAGCARDQPQPATPPAAAEPAVSTPAGRLYVTNENSGDLTVIDTATRQVIASIPLGKRPRGIKVSPDGSTLYVALSGSPIAPPGTDESKLPPPDREADGIGVVDVKQGKLLRVINGGSDPEQTAISTRWPLAVRGERGCRTDERDRRSAAGVWWPRCRLVENRKALTCAPTARSFTSRLKRITRSR